MVKRSTTKALNAGAAVSSTIKTTSKDMKDGAVFVAKGIGFGAKQAASIVADFGRGLKRGWERS